MRILVINHYAVPPRVGGGTRHVDLAREWAALGHDVVIVGSNFNHFSGAQGERLPRVTQVAPRVRIRSIWTPGYRGNGVRRMVDMVFFAIAVAIRVTFATEPDLILGSSPHPFAAFAAQLAAKLRRIPYVFEVRDLWPQTLVDLGGLRANSTAALALYAVERWLVERSDAVVGIPPAMNRYFDEKGLAATRFVHIPNGAGSTPALKPSQELLEGLGLAECVYFAYAGSLGAANGVSAVVDAIALLSEPVNRPPVKLVIMGDGPERKALESRAHEVAPSRVVFTGQMTKDLALGLIQQSEATIFHLVDAPVFRFGLSPNKLMDYLGAGRPVIYAGPKVPNPASASGVEIDAFPGDPRSIVKGMHEVLAMSRVEQMRRGTAGRAFVDEHHRMDRLADSYLRLFEELQ